MPETADVAPPADQPASALDIAENQATSYTWAGVIAHLDVPDTHGAVLLPKPLQDFDHVDVPFELNTTKLGHADAGQAGDVVGTVARVWRHGTRIYAAGTVAPTANTPWAEHLLTAGWHPVTPVCLATNATGSDNNDWWGHDRDPDIDFPPVHVITEWTLLAVSFCIHPPWPGTFLKLTNKPEAAQ